MENITVVTMKRLLIGSELRQLKITLATWENYHVLILGQQSTHKESLEIKLEIGTI